MGTVQRAFARLEIKSVDAASRRFSGIATTFATDRMGDIVESKGAQFKLPIPLLWQHDAHDPIGWITSARVKDGSIEVEGEVAAVTEPPALAERLATAWGYIKSKLVRGLSIGFSPLEWEPIKGTYGSRFTKWEWLELSSVTIPANQEASILAIKSADSGYRRAASGASAGGSGGALQSGVSGSNGSATTDSKGHAMKTLQEQIAELRETRATKGARIDEVTQGRPEGWADELRALVGEITKLDEDIFVKEAQALAASTARPVQQRSGAGLSGMFAAGQGAAVGGRTDKEQKFKGQNFVRKLIAQTVAQLDNLSASGYAAKRWGSEAPQLVQVLRANEVAGGGAGSGEWGAELVSADNRYTGDFIEYLYAQTIYDRLPLREVPEDVTIKGQDGTASGYWIGEGKAIKVSAQDYSTVSLTPLKVAALSVVTEELLRRSSPSAEMLIRDSLVNAAAQIIDTTFLGAVDGSAGNYPAGILYGVAAGTSGGNFAEDVRRDIAALMAPFITAKNTGGLTFVANRTLALQLSLLHNAMGQREFPDVTINGGSIAGVPLVVGDNVAAGDFILMKPSDIWKIGDLGIRVSLSRDATIAQNSAPAGETLGPTGETQAWNNMFQTESVAFKVVRPMNWAKRRSGVVQYIGDADYTGQSSV